METITQPQCSTFIIDHSVHHSLTHPFEIATLTGATECLKRLLNVERTPGHDSGVDAGVDEAKGQGSLKHKQSVAQLRRERVELSEDERDLSDVDGSGAKRVKGDGVIYIDLAAGYDGGGKAKNIITMN